MSFSFSLNLLKFEDVRSQIVEYLKENSDFSAQFDFDAANISLIIDSMAYVSMLMSYQLSNVANNLFLDSTIIRKNAVSIAKTMGYRPKRVLSSKIYGTIQYVDDTQDFSSSPDYVLTIPAQSVFISNKGYEFINSDEIKMTVSDTNTSMLTAPLILTEGKFKTFTYLGNGQPYQKFTIPSTKVEENNFILSVRDNISDSGTEWTEVKQSFNLINQYSYFVEEDVTNEGYVNVLFGDGSLNYYPQQNEIVDVNYLESNSVDANGDTIAAISESSLSAIHDLNFNIIPSYNSANFVSISDTTGTSYGGKQLETTEEIQANAPKSFAAVGRAVTQNDYKTILNDYSYIYKANVIGGDSLYPNDSAKLGNVYISCIPVLTNIYDLYNNDVLYLVPIEEYELKSNIDKYRVISTKINFLKPSYVEVNITPIVETTNKLTSYEVNQLTAAVSSTLDTFIKNNYNDFNISFRTSRFNGEINNVKNVLSSDISCSYSFALTNESFYEGDVNDDTIFLPVKIKDKDLLGIPISYENFIQTNLEKMEIENLSYVPIPDRTIYGTINSTYTNRYIYNEDNIPVSGDAETCDIMIGGKTNIFSFYRYPNNDAKIVYLDPNASIVNTNDPTSGDYYEVTYNGETLGTLYRTMNLNYGFKGIAESEASLISNAYGDFYNVVSSFSISGIEGALAIGDYIISDGVDWIKAQNKGTITALTDEELYTINSHNDIYSINVSGDFGGLTSPVATGDYIIFNINSLNATKFEKCTLKFTPELSASMQIPPSVVDYEIKRVVNLDSGSTNFNDGVSGLLYDDDLIFYNASLTAEPEPYKWVKLGNVAVSAIATSFPTTVNAQPLVGCTLDVFDYNTLPIGTAYRVVGIGNFGMTEQSQANYIKMNYPSFEDTAYDNDIIVYIGKIGADANPTWNIWQESSPQVFNIDGNIATALPIKLAYGEIYTVAGSGDFDGTIDFIANDGDLIVYVDDNNWIKNNPISGLDASSASGLPTVAALGDYFKISEDGNFYNSSLIAPSGQSFVQGDYIIFNGTNYVYMNEYTFLYNNVPDMRVQLNDWGFNSTFNYEYDVVNRVYTLFFNDKYNGQIIGTFRYNSNNPIESGLSVGQLVFNNYIVGKQNEIEITDSIPIKNLFDDTINKIRFIPKHKRDVLGNISQELEQNFDTTFNIVTTITTEPTQIQL